MEKINLALKNIERPLPLLTKLCVLLGGGMFVYYGISHDAIPDSLSLGDSVRLIVIAVVAGFNIAVGLIVVVLPAASCLDAFRRAGILYGKYRSRKIADQRKKNKVRRMYIKKTRMFLPKFNPVIYSSLFVWALYGTVLLMLGKLMWVGKWFLLLALFSALIWCGNAYFHKRSYFNRPGDVSQKKKKDKTAVGIMCVLSVLIATVSAFILGFINPVAVQTMKTMSIRQENISLFVKSPSADVLKMYIPASGRSGTVPQYIRFDNVTLSLSGMGSTDAIELKDGDIIFSLRIPASDVLPAPGLKDAARKN